MIDGILAVPRLGKWSLKHHVQPGSRPAEHELKITHKNNSWMIFAHWQALDIDLFKPTTETA